MRKSNSPLNIETNQSGSPQSGEPLYMAIGKFRRSHGVHGEMLMDVETDFPERIVSGLKVFVGKDKKEYTLATVRPTAKELLVSVEGFEDCDVVVIFRNQQVFIKEVSAMPLPDGTFYRHEVVGMKVVNEAAEVLGVITEILVTGANDVYVVKTSSGEELLFPAIKSVILKMDRDSNKVTVRPQEWA